MFVLPPHHHTTTPPHHHTTTPPHHHTTTPFTTVVTSTHHRGRNAMTTTREGHGDSSDTHKMVNLHSGMMTTAPLTANLTIDNDNTCLQPPHPTIDDNDFPAALQPTEVQ